IRGGTGPDGCLHDGGADPAEKTDRKRERQNALMAIDPSAHIAPTARVHPDAVIGPRSRIGEFCVIEQDVEIGADCLFEPYCFVKRWTTLGDGNEISAGTVLGTDPLDKNFTG